MKPNFAPVAPSSEERTSYEKKKWGALERLIVAFSASGQKGVAIAKILNISSSLVSETLNDPRAHLEMEQIGRRIVNNVVDAKTKLDLAADEAVEELIDQMRHGEKDIIRQRAAVAILDRAGYTPVQRKVGDQKGTPVSDEVLSRMEAALNETNEAGRNVTYLQRSQVEREEEDDSAAA